MKPMHLSIAVLASLSLASLAQSAGISDLDKDDPVRLRWDAYKSKHNKQYSSHEEENSRFELFMKRLRYANKHNAESRDMRLEVNHLSDLSDAELKHMNGLRMSEKVDKVTLQELGALIGDDEPPASLNWAEKGNVVGPIRNQGRCGSCWAFATAGLLEGQERRNSTGQVVQLSEQQLVDCNRAGNNSGCGGGLMNEALDYIKQVGGLQSEQDYSYISGKGNDNFECHFDETKAVVSTRRLKEAVVLELKSEDELKKVLANYGPIAIVLDASLSSFTMYRSGIYYDEHCSSEHHNHALLLVGYGTSNSGQEYWIIKNSWSQLWGQKGYMWLARNKNNHCGILNLPTISIAMRD